jgi:hypothetical protein
LFAKLDTDTPGALDAVRDLANMPFEEEPATVRADLEAINKLSNAASDASGLLAFVRVV